jgi:Ca2+-binding RTX toxin-like protein
MANITGTEGNDTLRGTNIDPLAPPNDFSSGADTINALGGDDLIIGSTGNDTINGGAGKDSLDFSNIGRDLFLSYNGSQIDTSPYPRRFPPFPGENAVQTFAENIETVIGDPGKFNTINDFSRYFTLSNVDVDLSNGRVTRRITDVDSSGQIVYSTASFTVKNFDNISLGASNGRFIGNDRDNNISVAVFPISPDSSVTIVGSKGNDTLFGNTLDYSNLNQTIKFFAPTVSGSSSANVYLTGKVNKGNFGIDQIRGFKKIIGATNKSNTIDLSTSSDPSGADLNLGTNVLQLKNPYYDPNLPLDGPKVSASVVNFVNAVGTKGNDTIVGANKNSKLTGGGGNDTITGGSKNDRITGTDATARGVGEVDTLTGGGGRDKFVLGDSNGAYYVGKGNNDYALITDFDLFKDSISIGSFKNYSFALEGNNTINLFSGKDVKTRDLIAKIQISGGISSNNANSRSIAGSSPNLNSIISKIDILSGSESERES